MPALTPAEIAALTQGQAYDFYVHGVGKHVNVKGDVVEADGQIGPTVQSLDEARSIRAKAQGVVEVMLILWSTKDFEQVKTKSGSYVSSNPLAITI